MKKLYTFLTLLLVSGVVFSQTQRAGGIGSIKIVKEINTLPANHSKAVVDSLNYDGANAGNAIGTNSAGSFGVYSFFPAATLAPHISAGHKILSVKVYVNDVQYVTAAQIRIYSDQGITSLFSQNFTPTLGWNEVTFTTPFTFPATGDIYLGYYLTVTGGYPLGCDAGPVNTNGNWIDYSGSWMHLTDLGATLTYNWNIRAMCGTVPSNPVASCTPLSWAANNVPIGSTLTSGTFTLTNTGAGTLTVSDTTSLTGYPWRSNLKPATIALTTGQSRTFTFKYVPAFPVGPATKVYKITTNGGIINITLNGNGVDCSALSVYPWSESFESTVFPPACWTKQNPDGGTGWNSVAVNTTPLPGWADGTMSVPPSGGAKSAYCTWNTGGATANDQYLITRQLTAPSDPMLTFWLFWYGHYQDYVDIKVSTTSNAVANFTTTIASLDTTQFIHNTWKQFNYPLSYSGQNIYIAFNEHIANNTTDGAFIALDMVNLFSITGVEENPAEMVSVFPNPANDKIFIIGENVKSVQIFNVLGESVGYYGQVKEINVSSLSKGFYFVKVITDGKTITRKINIAR